MTGRYILAIMLGAALPGACLAANATHPYANIDPRVDAGNDTGDSRVDQLNQAQLDQPAIVQPRAPRGPYGASPQPGYPGGYAPNGYAPPPYAPPPPGYAPPPGYYPPPS